MHIGFDFVVRNLPPPTIGYDFDSKCTVSHSPAFYHSTCNQTSSVVMYTELMQHVMAGQVCYAGSIHKESSPVHVVDSSGFEAVLVGG